MGYTKLIVGITGNALDVDVDNFLAMGANRVLMKPVRDDMLSELIAEALKAKTATTKLMVASGAIS